MILSVPVAIIWLIIKKDPLMLSQGLILIIEVLYDQDRCKNDSGRISHNKKVIGLSPSIKRPEQVRNKSGIHKNGSYSITILPFIISAL